MSEKKLIEAKFRAGGRFLVEGTILYYEGEDIYSKIQSEVLDTYIGDSDWDIDEYVSEEIKDEEEDE